MDGEDLRLAVYGAFAATGRAPSAGATSGASRPKPRRTCAASGWPDRSGAYDSLAGLDEEGGYGDR
ncbi:MAG TPA: hypothetical protein VGD83_04145, partial [Streptosporangiaceae bacterium]